MRKFRVLGALMAVLAFSAIAVATASAAESRWELLPGEAETAFTGKSGKASLQVKGGATISCKASEVKEKEGELLSTTSALAIIDFSGCTVGGLGVSSLGDTGNVILVHVEILNCRISSGDNGLYLKILPLHLEVPSTKLLLAVEGGLIALIAPIGKGKEFSLTIEQKEGVQAISACEGGEARSLETSTDGSEFVQSGEEAKSGTLTFASEQEVMS